MVSDPLDDFQDIQVLVELCLPAEKQIEKFFVAELLVLVAALAAEVSATKNILPEDEE